MPDLSILGTPSPYHILSYGTLLGTQVFQSFVAGVVGYKVLSRPQFSVLQQAIFPVYFAMQTALPAVLAITYPGENTVLGRSSSSISGVLEKQNWYSVLIPILTVFATSAINMTVLGPATTRIMRERKHQETRDKKMSYDPPPHSKDMRRLNKAFARAHGASALLNLIGLLGTVWYGLSLAERI